MTTFIQTHPADEDQWRAIVLFGLNAASYKFALSRALLSIELPDDGLIRLEDLALPFGREVARHLNIEDKQGTSSSSRFLDVCRRFNKQNISQDEFQLAVTRLGFQNVINAFHVVNRKDVPTRFFIDERREHGGIRVTDALYALQQHTQAGNLFDETEARWRLVETAWSIGISPHLLEVKFDEEGHILYVQGKGHPRRNITSCRGALDGYQKGRCFYCHDTIHINSDNGPVAHVDHFFPHCLAKSTGWTPQINIDGIWNLVLACATCNAGPGGKFAKVPTIDLLERLNTRNEYLIESHHPLRETLRNQTGMTAPIRHAFLQKQWNLAKSILVHEWSTEPVDDHTL